MYDCYLTFRSITAAQRGALVLNQLGIRHQLTRTPKLIAVHGCGYSLIVRQNDGTPATDALRRAGVPFFGLYCRGKNGELEVNTL